MGRKWEKFKTTMHDLNACHIMAMFLLGQLCSFLFALSGVCMTHMKSFDLELPFTTNMVPYLMIGFLTTPYAVYSLFKGRSAKDIWEYFKQYGYIYLIIALCEVCYYWATTSAYFLTNMVSVQSLSSFAIFSAMVLSLFLFRLKYFYLHYFGMTICLLGFAMMITADYMAGIRTDINIASQNRTYIFSTKIDVIMGDFITIVGSICFGCSLTLQEYIIQKDGNLVNMGTYSLMAILTLVPFILGFERLKIQAIILKAGLNYYPVSVGWAFFSYGVLIVLITILINVFLSRANSILLNLSLLTTNFYSLILATFIFKEKFSPLYAFSFCMILFGCFMFSFIHPEKKTSSVKKAVM